MSIAMMTLAWKSAYQSGRKMVLLALCDNANDQGQCYPSISMLSEKCSMSERSVFSHIAELEKDGSIHRENRPGRSTIYRIDPCKFCTPATVAPLQRLHPTPATVAPITIIEPSIEPSAEPKKKSASAPPDGVSDSVWADFKKIRVAKKAPLTETALTGIMREAEKAGLSLEAALKTCCERGWQGFKADWVIEKTQGKPGQHFNRQEALEASNAAVAERFLRNNGYDSQ